MHAHKPFIIFAWLALLLALYVYPGFELKGLVFGLIIGYWPFALWGELGAATTLLSMYLLSAGEVWLCAWLMDRGRLPRSYRTIVLLCIIAGALITYGLQAGQFGKWKQGDIRLVMPESHEITMADYRKLCLIPATLAGGMAGLYLAMLLGVACIPALRRCKRTSVVPLLLAVALVALQGCTSAPPAQAGIQDALLGWYIMHDSLQLAHRATLDPITEDHLIPIFKDKGVYYTVWRGFEVGLNIISNGLQCGSDTNLPKVAFTLDSATSTVQLVILDPCRERRDTAYVKGRKYALARTDKPGWLPDTPPWRPQTTEDLIGEYQCAWMPGYVLEVQKAGGEYFLRHRYYETQKQDWTEIAPAQLLQPMTNRLGFCLPTVNDYNRRTAHLQYEPARMTLEYDLTLPRTSPPVKFPLAPLRQQSRTVKYPMDIGVPVWND